MSEQERAAGFPLAELSGTEGGPGELAGPCGAPLFWPDLLADRAVEEWQAPVNWVARAGGPLRVGHPRRLGCWRQHNHLVEALVALGDHERGCYAATWPPTAAVEFHKALRDIDARLNLGTDPRCDARHDPSHGRARSLPVDGLEDRIATDVQRRAEDAIDPALADT